jgi:hypothetical protein
MVSGVRFQVSGFERQRVSDPTRCAMVKKNNVDVLGKTLERKVPEKDRRWQVFEEFEEYNAYEE